MSALLVGGVIFCSVIVNVQVLVARQVGQVDGALAPAAVGAAVDGDKEGDDQMAAAGAGVGVGGFRAAVALAADLVEEGEGVVERGQRNAPRACLGVSPRIWLGVVGVPAGRPPPVLRVDQLVVGVVVGVGLAHVHRRGFDGYAVASLRMLLLQLKEAVQRAWNHAVDGAGHDVRLARPSAAMGQHQHPSRGLVKDAVDKRLAPAPDVVGRVERGRVHGVEAIEDGVLAVVVVGRDGAVGQVEPCAAAIARRRRGRVRVERAWLGNHEEP
jgi:hypothetical protein